MSLPAKPSISTYFQQVKPKNLILPIAVVFFLLAILFIGVILPSQNKKPQDKTRDTSALTKTNKVKLSGGKEVELAPVVKQITPEALQAAIASKDKLTLIEIFSGEEWQEPKIAGSILMKKSDFDFGAPANIDKASYNVYVSSDGYDSALVVSKLTGYGYSSDNNVSLEGGLKAWKAKGYALQP